MAASTTAEEPRMSQRRPRGTVVCRAPGPAASRASSCSSSERSLRPCRQASSSELKAYGHSLLPFPALDGRHVPSQVRGNLLPRIKATLGWGLGQRFVEGWFAHWLSRTGQEMRAAIVIPRMVTAKDGIWPQMGRTVYCCLLNSSRSPSLYTAFRATTRRDATAPATPPLISGGGFERGAMIR